VPPACVAPTNLRIGSIRTGTAGGFSRREHDDARIYNYVMNASEIGALLNTPPSLAAISNRVIMAGTILNITQLRDGCRRAAANPDLRSRRNSARWRDHQSEQRHFQLASHRRAGGMTNLFTVQVADNGTPVMTDAKNFSVTVNRPALPGLSNASIINGQFRLTIAGDFGPDYTVLASTNLTIWISIFTTNQPTLPFVFGIRTLPITVSVSIAFASTREKAD